MGRMGTPLISFDRYNKMAQALKKTGRSILYSLCSWGEDFVHTVSCRHASARQRLTIMLQWGGSIANSWRVSGDIYDSFARPDELCGCGAATDPHCIAPGTHCSVLAILNKVAPYIDRGMPGAWNDLDMLEVGFGGMTDEEVSQTRSSPQISRMLIKSAVQSSLFHVGRLEITYASRQ